jgi:hypothetical protein
LSTSSWTHAAPKILQHIAENPHHAALVSLTTKTIQIAGELCSLHVAFHGLSRLLGSVTYFSKRSETLNDASFMLSKSVAATRGLLPGLVLSNSANLVAAKLVTATNGDVVSCLGNVVVWREGVCIKPLL